MHNNTAAAETADAFIFRGLWIITDHVNESSQYLTPGLQAVQLLVSSFLHEQCITVL